MAVLTQDRGRKRRSTFQKWGLRIGLSLIGVSLLQPLVGFRLSNRGEPVLAASQAKPSPQPSKDLGIDEILARLEAAHDLTSSTVKFIMDIDVRTRLGSSSFKANVEKKGDVATIQTRDAPWFVPDEITSTLVEIDGMLSDFDMRLDEVTNVPGVGKVYVVSGRRKAGVSTGAKDGKIWISAESWRVTRAEAHYWWGSLKAELVYGTYKGRVVVTRQVAEINPLGIWLNVRYSNYQFGDEAR